MRNLVNFCLAGEIWQDEHDIFYRIEGANIRIFGNRNDCSANMLQSDALCFIGNQLHWRDEGYCWQVSIPDGCGDNIDRIQWLPLFPNGKTYHWYKAFP